MKRVDDRISAPSGNETFLFGKPGRKSLSRREILAMVGSTSAAAVFGAVTASQALGANVACVEAVPEQMEGPMFVDEVLNRSDIRIDPTDGSVKAGVPLNFSIQVHDLSGGACGPLKGAHVDVWLCDAEGLYSDVPSNKTLGKKFLRGYQVTDGKGMVKFSAVYPGWYHGRTAHIHMSVRTFSGPRNYVPRPAGECCAYSQGEVQKYVTQIYFPDSITEEVYKMPPYDKHQNRDTTNATDGIFNRAKTAERGMLNLTKTSKGAYAGNVVVGVSLKPAEGYHFNGRAGAPPGPQSAPPK